MLAAAPWIEEFFCPNLSHGVECLALILEWRASPRIITSLFKHAIETKQRVHSCSTAKCFSCLREEDTIPSLDDIGRTQKECTGAFLNTTSFTQSIIGPEP